MSKTVSIAQDPPLLHEVQRRVQRARFSKAAAAVVQSVSFAHVELTDELEGQLGGLSLELRSRAGQNLQTLPRFDQVVIIANWQRLFDLTRVVIRLPKVGIELIRLRAQVVIGFTCRAVFMVLQRAELLNATHARLIDWDELVFVCVPIVVRHLIPFTKPSAISCDLIVLIYRRVLGPMLTPHGYLRQGGELLGHRVLVTVDDVSDESVAFVLLLLTILSKAFNIAFEGFDHLGVAEVVFAVSLDRQSLLVQQSEHIQVAATIFHHVHV